MPLGEFELIDRWFRRPSRDAPGVVLGIGDDAALLRVPDGHELVAAIDTIVAGRHFLPDAKAHAIGHQALAVNLSDLAAMGAKPAWALLALTLPQGSGPTPIQTISELIEKVMPPRPLDPAPAR